MKLQWAVIFSDDLISIYNLWDVPSVKFISLDNAVKYCLSMRRQWPSFKSEIKLVAL